MKQYDSYKPSGIDWIGEIPSHWEEIRVKNILDSAINGVWGDDPKGDENDLICVRVADFDYGKLGISVEKLTYRNIPLKQQNERLLNKDDLLLEKSGGGELQPVGRVVRFNLDRKAVCSNFIARLKVNKAKGESAYVSLLLNALYFNRINLRSIKQTTGIQNLDGESFYEEHVGLPPLPEQTAIAHFLDQKTVQIDTLIDRKRRLIDLLREEKTALINEAVTKGIHPDVPMKDSGVEWLGEIPAHWEVMPIKYDLEFVTSGSRGWAEYYADEGELFIRIGNLTRDSFNLDLSDIQYVQVPDGSEGARTTVKTGDLVVSITAYLGSVAIIPTLNEKAYVSQHVALARPKKEKLLDKWIAYCILSNTGKTHFELQAYGGTKIQLSLDDIRNMPILSPPIIEQSKIIDYLETETARIDYMISRIEREVELMQEYRTALISEVVTGKVKVV
jgi:type I restriction enzyme S subunit